MISYLADLLKVGNENAQKLKKQRENEAKAEIEQILFKDKINAFKIAKDYLPPHCRESKLDDDGLYRFMNMERLDIAKMDLKVKDPRYDFTTCLLHTLEKTPAFFKRYGGDKETMRNFIEDTITELEPKYQNAIYNTKKAQEKYKKT